MPEVSDAIGIALAAGAVGGEARQVEDARAGERVAVDVGFRDAPQGGHIGGAELAVVAVGAAATGPHVAVVTTGPEVVAATGPHAAATGPHVAVAMCLCAGVAAPAIAAETR
eukprot:3858577-Alexandrium_andersonii.AAC.1